jgi:hypothetical protein
MQKPLIFISFSAADEDVAKMFRSTLSKAFLGQFETFMSGEDILPGDEWQAHVHQKLKDCKLLIAIVTTRSAHRAWINYEIGATSIQDKKVIAIIGPGLDHKDLPSTYDTRQAVSVGKKEDFEKLLKTLMTYLPGTLQPETDFSPFIEFFNDFERKASKRGDLIEILDQSNKVQNNLPTWLNGSSKSAILCGVHFQKSLSDHRALYHDAIKRGVTFTFAILDPDSPDVESTAKSFDMDVEELRLECVSGLQMLKNLKSESVKLTTDSNTASVEFVLLKSRANARYYIFDDEQADGIIAYTPYMDGRSTVSPTYVYGTENTAAIQYVAACKGLIDRNRPGVQPRAAAH